MATSVQAMKAGAVEFLTKPFRDQQLRDAIQQAIDRDRLESRQQRERAELRRVMTRVVASHLNKQIAASSASARSRSRSTALRLCRRCRPTRWRIS
jgi:FixJ family two-component response regulator